MLPSEVDAIVRAEGASPIEFSYFRHAFASKLLAYAVGGGRPISALRQGAFGKLLAHPSLEPAMTSASRGVLRPAHLRIAEKSGDTYFITLAKWGGSDPSEWSSPWYQTSRAGQNLVVQLGFPEKHDRAYHHLIGEETSPFICRSHPVRLRSPYTLGWARLDIDFLAGEVLIEEVQSDWVKYALPWQALANDWLQNGEPDYLSPHDELPASAREILVYIEQALSPHARSWQDCTLSATLHFIYEHLGLRRVFFHTYEGGLCMKRLNPELAPPRSLYTDLPRRFCFTPTRSAPAMFRTDPRVSSKREPVLWQVLDLCG